MINTAQKFRHYYANPTLIACETEQDELVATCSLTRAFVLAVIADRASGVPPYTLFVPRDILYEAHTWNIPTTLLQIVPTDGKGKNDVSPCDVSQLEFRDVVCIIHARRLRQSFHHDDVKMPDLMPPRDQVFAVDRTD